MSAHTRESPQSPRGYRVRNPLALTEDHDFSVEEHHVAPATWCFSLRFRFCCTSRSSLGAA
eukprot:1527682-Amphidinium_carterae.1